jgi:lipopolysaccharide transport system ATP-binding protein
MPTPNIDCTYAVEVNQVSKSYRLWHDSSDPVRFRVASAIAGIAGHAPRPEKYFRSFHALSDVTFSTRPGESFAIIGRNGSGKSTLLQIIAGTLQSTSGTVRLNGRVAALLELGSGFNPEFTGRENVFLNASILGLTTEVIEARFESIARFADIGDFMDQPVKIYSTGMALRLAFAVIAHIDATVLIIDEALAVGDVFFMQKCMRFLREFRERGTLLFVSHDMSSVRSLCDSALWLDSGAVRMRGSAQDVTAAYLAESNLSQLNSEVVNARESKLEAAPAAHAEARRATFRDLPKVDIVNLLVVSPFNAHSSGYGDGRIKISDVRFIDDQGAALQTIEGGDVVRLRITSRGIQSTGNVIFGFNLKDRLGQYLFGENTFRRINAIEVHPEENYHAIFCFQMPVLHRGQYAVTAAVASGTPDNHRQQHWLHEALIITSATDWPHAGLIGLPMFDIRIEKARTLVRDDRSIQPSTPKRPSP